MKILKLKDLYVMLLVLQFDQFFKKNSIFLVNYENLRIVKKLLRPITYIFHCLSMIQILSTKTMKFLLISKMYPTKVIDCTILWIVLKCKLE